MACFTLQVAIISTTLAKQRSALGTPLAKQSREPPNLAYEMQPSPEPRHFWLSLSIAFGQNALLSIAVIGPRWVDSGHSSASEYVDAGQTQSNVCFVTHNHLTVQLSTMHVLTFEEASIKVQVNYLGPCEGRVSVVKNCFSALSHLRRRDGDCFVWIDATCINRDHDKG